MDGEWSCKFDQLPSLQIRKGFLHIGAKHLSIDVILFSQRVDNLTHRSSIAAANNVLRGFVQFEQALRKKQDAVAGLGIGLEPDSAGEPWLCGASDRGSLHLRRTVGVMDRIENGPEHIAFKLERAHCLALKLRRVAIVQRYRERFIGVTSCLSDSATEVIKAARIDPGIIFFESRETCGHQIGCEKFRER